MIDKEAIYVLYRPFVLEGLLLPSYLLLKRGSFRRTSGSLRVA